MDEDSKSFQCEGGLGVQSQHLMVQSFLLMEGSTMGQLLHGCAT